MKTNESGLDRVIRIVLGIALLVLFFTHVVSGTLGTVLVIVGAVSLFTGLTGFCAIYALLKIRTNKS
jgi:hypothetical protein